MSETTEIKTLGLDEIRIDGGTQPRVAIDKKTVAEYAKLLKCEIQFPPVVVFYDGTTYWLADGFHRYFASKQIECDCICTEVHTGTQREAILYSVGANAGHGLQRTNRDKRKAILILLKDKEWGKWSDSEIAKRCGVSPTTVGAKRTSLSKLESDNSSPPRTYKTKHGTVAKMNTSNIGRPAKKKFKPTGEIAKDAFCIRQPHSQGSPVPMRNVNLPLNNPQRAAQCMFSVYGEEYMQALCNELNTIFQKKGLSNVK